MANNNLRSLAKIVVFPLVLFVHAYRAYKGMQNWHRNVVGGRIQVKTHLPKGIFTIDARSALARVAFTGTYEKHLMKQLGRLKIGEGLIVNIGANIGLYAVQLSKVFPNHSILAIEPNPEAFELLNLNIFDNGIRDRVQTVNACVSNDTGRVQLAYIPGKAEYSSIGGIVHEATRAQVQETIEVDSFPLAALLNGQKVSLIMMDVEGAEVLVLQGAERVLSTHHPVIICECEENLLNKFGHSSRQMVQMLENLGYQVLDERKPTKEIVYPLTGNIIARHGRD